MVKIAPSILSADFAALGDDVRRVADEADLMHIDVMDGHFVPNITIGPDVVKSLRPLTETPFDTHLMITNPGKYIKKFVDAGSNIVTVHAEECPHLHRTLQALRSLDVKAGVALNPSTPLSSIENVLDELDMVVIMTVNPGFGGQRFIKNMIPKIETLSRMIREKGLDVDIEVDGGINDETARDVTQAGAEILVAGSAVYGKEDPIAAIKSIRTSAEGL
jgi:ribulose-phosphate 3-epimerase